ncbi:MAG: hypothetical protein P9X24_15715 [Candidatus Hatepunaea meridiana]|nr:hypothetical protein [Candidatus Hatepunaea meridiana]
MAESWGNDNAGKFDEDLVSDPNNANILKVNDVDNNDADRPAIFAKNSDVRANARALKIEGMAEITANIPEWPNGGTVGLKVIHSNPARGDALEVEGASVFNGSIHIDGDVLTKSNSGSTVAISDVNEGNDDKIALHTINSSNNPDALSLKAEGTVDLDGIRIAAGGWINTSGLGLNLGTSEPTDNVRIGRSQKDTYIAGNHLYIDGNDLKLRVANVLLSGCIDADPAEEVDDLSFGTNEETLNVKISRPNQTTIVQGDLQVDGEFEGQGAMRALANLFVGTNENDGLIDANGTENNRDLKIGNTDLITNNVILSRLGKLVDILGKLRINGNELILDNSESLATGSGIKINPTGQGSFSPSIDVIVSGTCVFYFDSEGGHSNV